MIFHLIQTSTVCVIPLYNKNNLKIFKLHKSNLKKKYKVKFKLKNIRYSFITYNKNIIKSGDKFAHKA